MKRHTAAKHAEASEDKQDENQVNTDGEAEQTNGKSKFTLDMDKLKYICRDTAGTLSENKCYPESIRKESKQWQPEIKENLLPCKFLTKLGPVAEKFYSLFFAKVVQKSAAYFPDLQPKVSTLFATKLANATLHHCITSAKVQPEAEAVSSKTSKYFSEKEIAGLQYLGGYVFSSLYKKLRNSSSWKSDQCQQSLSILKAAKLDKIDASQQLINSVNRGGLWFISTAAQNIFVKTEQHFRKATEEETILRSISRDAIIVKCLKDVDIISNFKTVVDNAELQIEKNTAADILQAVVRLYITVRCYSFANDVVQKYKTKLKLNNNNKKRSHIQLDSRKQVIAFQDRVITINIKEAQHPLKREKQVIDK